MRISEERGEEDKLIQEWNNGEDFWKKEKVLYVM